MTSYNNKFTYFILILALFLSSSCEDESPDLINVVYLDIPDEHFESILIEQGIDSDSIINQQMLRTDAEKVSRLDLNLSAHFGEVKDLTGIEGFVNLKLLSAGNQELTHVDLSHNTLLDTIYLLGNMLTSIDLSNNTSLIFVDLQVNEFSSSSSIIGLSKLTFLKDLDLSWNYLEEFSIHNESLEILHISHNDLVSLDTDGAISLQHILGTSNKLESVDFSTNVSLETLLISDNNLQHFGLETNTSLTHLYSSSNLLTGLDISKNHQIIDLRVDRNPYLTCIKILASQEIPTVSISEYQQLNTACN
ncbi:MAG: hypothetical protein RIC35_09420 [Marinoscillum sp.]